MCKFLVGIAYLCACSYALHAAAPTVFYTDLESGPNRGGEADAGAFVTVHGSGFGAVQATGQVTVGGGQVARYLQWSNTKISVQLGANARTGQLVVTTAAGTSNGVPFLVRPGVIYFVSTSGNDQTGTGSFTSPWRTILQGKKALRAGDILYAMDGVRQTTVDENTAAIGIRLAGRADAPITIAAYPGASVYVGDPTPTDSTSSPAFGLRIPNVSGGPYSHWVVSGIHFSAGIAMALSATNNWRVVGNTFECPMGGGPAACVTVSQSWNVKLLGNEIRNAGIPAGTKMYHSMYLTTDTNNVEVGWNRIYGNRSCRGIQVHSSPLVTYYVTRAHSAVPVRLTLNAGPMLNGVKVHVSGIAGMTGLSGSFYAKSIDSYNIALYRDPELLTPVTASGAYTGGGAVRFGQNQYGIDIHDNYIADQPCDGINLATVDPSKGAVRVYNNVLVNNGKGPSPADGTASYTCIYAPGTTNIGSTGTGMIEVFNNTLYSCGSYSDPTSGAINRTTASGNLKLDLRNNVTYALPGQKYFPYGHSANLTTGSNNVWHGAGVGPSQLIGNINRDPEFVNASIRDFHVRQTSPVVNAGVSPAPSRDYDGKGRPGGNYYDIGAYEYDEEGTTTPPTQPPATEPEFQPIRIDAGATAQYRDGLGNIWLPDSGFTGGTFNLVSGAISGGGLDGALYQTYRYGPSTYTFNVPNGTYLVTMKFAEPFSVPVGYRRFDVVANGTTVLTNFDVMAAASGVHKAVDRTFTVNVTGGVLTLKMQIVVQNPLVSAIEVKRM